MDPGEIIVLLTVQHAFVVGRFDYAFCALEGRPVLFEYPLEGSR